MPTERLTFPSHDGHSLAARLDLPEGPMLGTALFAHCFTCGKDIPAARRIAGRLAAMGIAVLRFDFTGLGHSQGEFGNTTFSSNVEDLKAAADAMTARGMAPRLLIGHSLGGAAVLRAAGEISGIRGVVSLNAPLAPAHVIRTIGLNHDDFGTKTHRDVDLGGRKFRIGRAFLDDVTEERIEPVLSRLEAALLVMHAPEDHVVGIENAGRIFRAAPHPKSFVTLDGADHLLSRSCDADYAAGMIASWAMRYLDVRPPAPPPGAPEGVVRVTEADPKGFLQDVTSGPYHHALADEPLAYGGTNRGMSPYGFLSSGLGACTSMTIRMYARRKGWPLESVRVEVTHEKVHAQDSSTGEKVDRFCRDIRLTGALDEAQRARLLEIADRCPVHRTLSSGAEISTSLSP
ncbi:putative redox protein [Poseidonocella pacifica]|uniref:Putative redox protein n=1 Tax=Poseidonocella pacifica TaxID=871651 RepID=A0A1I0VIN0_9RHOB|nr:bifunctional alpha/beta hydrolase/OsmC family protein [Poseidonocella pacifica]SFA76235.1 putative redox protein [Poseidonocella pacifica]